MRIAKVIAALVCCMAASCTSVPEAAATANQPNILFVLVDDLGYADFSITGNRKVQTPNIDALAAEGLLMTQFTVASPICSPSRAGLMTGQFPAEHRFVSFINDRKHNVEMGQANWLDPSLPTLPRALRDVGYATGHFGKWHLGGGRDIGGAPRPTSYGFDESYTQFEGLGPRALMIEDHAKLASRSAALGQGLVDWMPKAQLTGRYVDKTLDFVSRNADRPWFAQLWLDDVHDPWEPNAAQLAVVRGKGDDADEERFFAVLVAMDREIGRLTDALRARGELDDTIIVLTGDNGPTGARRYYRNGATPPGDTGGLRGRKASLYEGGLRLPLIVRWPGRIEGGKRDTSTVANAVDLFPTLASAAGASPPPAGDGVSLLQAWTAQPIGERPDIYYAYGGFGTPGRSPRPHLERHVSPPFAIRSGDWKLLAKGDGSHPELYDLARDPNETRNLAGSQPELVRTLSERLVTWRRSLPQ